MLSRRRLRHRDLRQVAPRRLARAATRRTRASTSGGAFRSRPTSPRYADQVGFDPAVAPIPQLLEGVAGRGGARGRALHAAEPAADRRADRGEVRRLHPRARRARRSPSSCSSRGRWSITPTCPTRTSRARSGNGGFADVDGRARPPRRADPRRGRRRRASPTDTLVLYLSDNGPDSAHYPVVSISGPFRGYLGSAFEGSIRTPMIARWPGQVPRRAGQQRDRRPRRSVSDARARRRRASCPTTAAIDGVDQTAAAAGRDASVRARERALLLGPHAARRQVAPLQDLPDRRRPGAARPLLAPAVGAARLQRRAGPARRGRHRHATTSGCSSR